MGLFKELMNAVENRLYGTGTTATAKENNGVFSFHPYSSDWELVKFKDSQATMKYEHRTVLEIEEDE